MGAVPSIILRRINRFNVENRAQRVISDPTPRPAPKYDTTIKEVEKLRREMPSLEEDLSKFDVNLHDRLKQVYITSTDVTPRQRVSKELPPLSPTVRRTSDFGFDEDDKTGTGGILLKDCVEMLMAYGQDNKTSIDDLAKKYNLQVEDARNIIKYYQCFRLVLPGPGFDQGKFFRDLLVGDEKGKLVDATEFFSKNKHIYTPSNLPVEGSSKSNQAGSNDPSDEKKLESTEKSPLDKK